MAINQQPIARTITLPSTQVSAGQGLTQLSNATGALNQLLTERVNEVAIGNAALQGEQDVQENRQPENLTLPFTKATKAYNDAVSNTEARRMVDSAQNLINESLITNKNPATFNRDTPAKFHSELEGIKSGILETTRVQNREHVREALDQLTAHASLNMLQHSIEYDNQRTQADFKQDISGLLEARRNAAIEGDANRIAGIDAALDQSLNDYSEMNQGIKATLPYQRAEIEKNKAIDTVLGGYSNAIINGSTSHFLSDLADNKDKLPFNIWQDAVKGVVQLDQEHSRLKNDINAEQVAQVNLGIQNNSITDASQILNYPELTLPQQLTAMKQLDASQAKQFKQGSEIITAQQNILSDRASWNSADTRNKMFQSQIQNLEQQTGQPATLVDMQQTLLGQNQYPASGMPNTAIGTNVPVFDSTISTKLTGKDPIATAQAALVYNDIVNVKGKPNAIKINGDALAVANLFTELYRGGTTPEGAAQQAIDTVLNAKEPEIAQRIDRFHKTLEKVDPGTGKNGLAIKYKDAFGIDPQTFGADESFRLFQDRYRANYLSSNSEEAAFNATKYDMQKYGTSKYFDKGYVGQPVPEKEVPIVNVGNAFQNQIASNIQGYINRTNAAREAHPDLNISKVEWADPNQAITFTESEQDKVFKKFTIGDKPRIKINGLETDVVLMPSPSSRLGDGGVNYLLGVYDQFNNLHPLKDITNGVDGVARFAPKELSFWAPGIATKKTDEAIREYALQVQQKEIQSGDKELKALVKKTPPWSVIFGLSKPDDYLQYISNREAQSPEGRLGQIVESLRENQGLKGAETTRDAITDADNVGISPSLEAK